VVAPPLRLRLCPDPVMMAPPALLAVVMDNGTRGKLIPYPLD
jgi:hypothetical protein